MKIPIDKQKDIFCFVSLSYSIPLNNDTKVPHFGVLS